MGKGIGVYEKLRDKYSEDAVHFKKRYNLVGLLRFITILALIILIVFYIKSWSLVLLSASVLVLGFFIIQLKYHSRVSHKRRMAEALLKINRDEIEFLDGTSNPFEDGSEYIDSKHAYS